MPIPAFVESEDQLPEGLADYYEQNDDGGYVLSVEGIDYHPQVRGVIENLEKNKKSRQKANEELRKLKEKASIIPDDIDQETLQQAIDRITQGGDDGEQAQGQGQQSQQGQQGHHADAAKVREQIEKRYQKQLEELQAERDKLDQRYRQREVGSQLDTALSKHGVTSPVLRRHAVNELSSFIETEYDDNGELTINVNADVDGMNIDQLVKNWLSTEEGQEFLPRSSGSGARGSGPVNGKGRKEMTREQFEQLSPEEKRKFAVEQRGQITG